MAPYTFLCITTALKVLHYTVFLNSIKKVSLMAILEMRPFLVIFKQYDKLFLPLCLWPVFWWFVASPWCDQCILGSFLVLPKSRSFSPALHRLIATALRNSIQGGFWCICAASATWAILVSLWKIDMLIWLLNI